LKRLLLYLVAVCISFLSSINNAWAQAPNISYSTPTNIYTVGTAITSLTPLNAGGAVPATTYGQVTTLVASGTGLSNPQAVTTDGAGNIYVADFGNNLIRKVTPAGVMTTFAGNGIAGELDGTGTAAEFNAPDGIAYDGTANLYVADATGNVIRKIVVATGVVTTYAGSGATGSANNATLLTSTFNGPAGLALDGSGNMYICDQGNNIIRMISGTTVSTLAGSGAPTAVNGTGTAASFNQPNDLIADGLGNVYVADYGNSLVRKIVVSTKVVTTFAGSGAAGYADGAGTAAIFNRLSSLCTDASGNLLIADLSNYRIRLITTPAAVVTTIAGSGTGAETNGTGTAAAFNNTGGICIDNSGNCYIVDFPTATTGTVRKMVLTGYTISPALPAGLSFNVTTGVISGTPTASSAATTYTITGYNAVGSSSFTISIACGVGVRWTAGSNTTAWATPGNWSPNGVPGVNDAVTIGVSAYTNNKEPAITAADVTVGSITFGSAHNGTLTITSPRTLTIGGNLTVNTGASPTITGTGAINIAPGANVSINGTGVLTNTLTGKFTLKSDATGSASMGPLASAAAFTGSGTSTIYVERYFTGGSNTYRAYRLVSSPVNIATVGSNNVYNLDYIKASALVTGAAGGGFDKTGNPTLYLFREDQAVSGATYTSGNFWGISAINNAPTYNLYLNGGATTYNLPVGNGFLFFFRGDRTTNLALKYTTTTSAESVTFTASGKLNIGQITVSDWYTPASSNIGFTNTVGNGAVQGYNLVGNPYASSIDWETFQTATTTTGIYGSSVGTTIYMLNPLTHNYGSYTKGGGGIGTNNATNIISSGQGFFVVATAATAKLIFNESAKSVSQPTGVRLFMGTPDENANVQYLRLQFAKDSINTDDMLVRFNTNATTAYNAVVDAPYKPGYGQLSLSSMSSDHIPLAINVQPLPKTSESISLKINTNADGIYSLNLKDLVGMPQLYDIWLMDAYKKDSLDMRQNKSYRFNVFRNDTNSYGSKRFTLVIRQNMNYAYQLINFTAAKAVPVIIGTKQVQVVWETRNEQNYTNFTVERSTDGGKTYDVIGSEQSNAQGTYSLLDQTPVNGQNLYRLKQEAIDNSITYSNIVPVLFSDVTGKTLANSLSVYPNPATASISLASGLTPTTAATYDIRFMTSSGIIVKQVTAAQPAWQGNVSNLTPGIYVIRMFNNTNASLVGETKFVKL